MGKWQGALCCVECDGALNPEFHCSRCGKEYDRASTGAPILMTAEDRQRFQTLLSRSGGSQMQAEYSRRLKRNWIRKLYPPEPVYVNPAAPPLPAPRNGVDLWIGGGGLQLPGFVNIDVAPVPGVDIVATAARLPFQTASCDSVACLALLEHVEDPERVVAEIHRTLKSGGAVQVVVPFCHPYHAYPADYSRFSRERLVDMFAGFQKVDIGIRTGPTTTMLTFLTYYLKLIFPVHGGSTLRRSFNRLLVGSIGWALFPLKYLDFWLNRLPNAHVLANHFYVMAWK
jgi:SAM-dependent methyltransferase